MVGSSGGQLRIRRRVWAHINWSEISTETCISPACRPRCGPWRQALGLPRRPDAPRASVASLISADGTPIAATGSVLQDWERAGHPETAVQEGGRKVGQVSIILASRCTALGPRGGGLSASAWLCRVKRRCTIPRHLFGGKGKAVQLALSVLAFQGTF